MLTRKVPLYFIFVAIFFSCLISVLGFKYIEVRDGSSVESADAQTGNPMPICDLNIQRLKGFQFVKPLVYAEPVCQSSYLQSYKNEIENIINSNKNQGNITSASVYLREFSQAQWIAINDTEKYSPGSLLKVPELIALYKMYEKDPAFFNTKVHYNAYQTDNKIISFESKHIEIGKVYTIKELINYMIVNSDNEATKLLNSIVDKNTFEKVFTDIGLEKPDFSSNEYKMNSKDYSVFFKELYNGSYLSFKNSEECLELLSKTDFNDGLMSGLPSGCSVIHKFGEGGQTIAPNFSESAIVYCGKKPYLITIMTKGTDMKKLPKVSSEISKKVYEIMSTKI